MTPTTLPQKLWRPLAEVKSFVEKMPDGVSLTKLSQKIGAFGTLGKREKDSLITFLEQRESILVLQARPVKGKNIVTFLRHKRFGYPREMPGYVYPLNHKPEPEATISIEKPAQNSPEPTMQLTTIESPEALRRKAEQLIKQAEEAERKRTDNDFFNKKLGPVKLEIGQAAGKMQRKLDEFIDCMDEMNQAIKKLKELCA